MNRQPREDLAALLAPGAPPCISVMLRADPTTPQGPLCYRNLLRDAERQASEQGSDAETLAPLLKQAYKLAGEQAFWDQPAGGVAVYAAPGFQRAYRLPYPVAERATIGRDFLITPLVPLLGADQPCYILALSLGAVRLLRYEHGTLGEMPLPAGVPTSLDDALQYDAYERERRVTPGRTGMTGRQGAIYFSHGIGSDERTGEIHRYCHQIDRGLRETLTPPGTPLILAGVDEITATYREVADYPHILTRGIVGNADHLGVAALHERARPVLAALDRQRGDEAVARYHDLAGTGRTSVDPFTIAHASQIGRVDTLLIAPTQAAAGPHNAITDDETAANRATIDTLLNGGTVIQVEPAALPDRAPLAVILRY